MDVTKILEGFSITHAAILDGDTGAEELNGDIYGVENANITPDLGTFDNVGDDTVRSTWDWFNKATIAIQAGYLPFDLVGLIYGSTVSSSGSGAGIRYDLPLWEQRGSNIITRPLWIRCEAKDNNDNARYWEFVFFKAKFKPISFNGPAYKDGLKINYSATVLMSSVNERGEVLAYDAVGRIMSKAQS